ncbi:MAG: hypothetical protein QM497_10255 [Sulfurimonas sp.]
MNAPQLDLSQFSIEYIVIIMAGIILYLLYYVFTKDSDYTKNIRSIASVVEELNRELFYLKKKLGETQENIKENSQRMTDEVIYQEIERTVYDMVAPLSQGLQQLQENINSLEAEIDTRVSHLESGVKQISIPSSIHGNDDEKIISLFKQSVSLDTIAKELHLSKPEVEFVLKINKLQ